MDSNRSVLSRVPVRQVRRFPNGDSDNLRQAVILQAELEAMGYESKDLDDEDDEDEDEDEE